MTNLERIRKERGITQIELAKLANVSQPFIHDLENGNRGARRETLQRIAAILDCCVDELTAEVQANSTG